MNIIKFISLELKAKKEGSLHAIRNKKKAYDLIELLNYLFYEYTRTDLDLIINNLEIIDEEKDDEIIMHGNNRTLCLDLKNPNIFHICSFSDYVDFEKTLTAPIENHSFVTYLQENELILFTIDRNDFLQLLQDWHTILHDKPQCILLYQNKSNNVGFKSFDSIKIADQYIDDHRK